MADATPAQMSQPQPPAEEGTQAAAIEAEKTENTYGGGHPLDPTQAARRGRPVPEKLDNGPQVDRETGSLRPGAYKKTRLGDNGKTKHTVVRQDF